MHAVLAWGSQVCFDSHSPMRHWTHWNTIAWKAQTHTSARLQLLSRVSLWMFECILYACSWPCPNYYGGDVGPAIWFQQASGELGDVCRRICERKSKPVPPGAAVIRQQSSALGTASAYDSLLVPRYLLPLPSSNSPRVKMRDTFEANVMRCLFLFSFLLQTETGGKNHARTYWWGLIWDMDGKRNIGLLCNSTCLFLSLHFRQGCVQRAAETEKT